MPAGALGQSGLAEQVPPAPRDGGPAPSTKAFLVCSVFVAGAEPWRAGGGSRGGFGGHIAHKGTPAPLQATRRWPVERTHSWMNGYGKLRRMTDHDATVVAFYLYLAAALVIIRQLIQRARKRYRWDTRPTTKRLK